MVTTAAAVGLYDARPTRAGMSSGRIPARCPRRPASASSPTPATRPRWERAIIGAAVRPTGGGSTSRRADTAAAAVSRASGRASRAVAACGGCGRSLGTSGRSAGRRLTPARHIQVDEVVKRRRPPATMGWRKAVYTSTGTLVNLGAGPHERSCVTGRSRSNATFRATTKSPRCRSKAGSAKQGSLPAWERCSPRCAGST